MFRVFLARQLFRLGRQFIAEKEAKLDAEVGQVIEHTTAEHLERLRRERLDG